MNAIDLKEKFYVDLPADYRPSEDEEFMNDKQRAYFRNKLLQWKNDILRASKDTIHHLHQDSQKFSDVADRASQETDHAIELRARDRQRKLIMKIDQALARIDSGDYGYCTATDEQIGLRRLEARPVATLSIEAQERHERKEKVYRND